MSASSCRGTTSYCAWWCSSPWDNRGAMNPICCCPLPARRPRMPGCPCWTRTPVPMSALPVFGGSRAKCWDWRPSSPRSWASCVWSRRPTSAGRWSISCCPRHLLSSSSWTTTTSRETRRPRMSLWKRMSTTPPRSQWSPWPLSVSNRLQPDNIVSKSAMRVIAEQNSSRDPGLQLGNCSV